MLRTRAQEGSAEPAWPETLAFAALWALWFAWFYRLWPIWEDHAVYYLMAVNWLGGGRPYVDAIDPNWPGAMLLHAVAFAVGGYASWGLRLVDAVLQVCLVGTTCRLLAAWRVDRVWRVVAVALYTITYFNGTFGTMAQREALALPFLLYGLLPWLLPAELPRTWSWPRLMFLHGTCLGMAVCIKPPLGVAMVVVGLGSLLSGGVTRRDWLRWVAAGAAGGFLWLGVVACLLWKAGSLAAFWYWGVQFAFSDYAAEKVAFMRRWVHVAKWLSGVGVLTAVTLMLGLMLWRVRGGGGRLWRNPLILLMWLLAGGFATVWAQGKTYCLYHFLPFFHAMAMVTAVIWSRVRLPLEARWRTGVYAGVAALLLACSVGYSQKPRAQSSGYTLGLQLRGELKPGENVAVIGFAPTLYLALEKQPPYPILNSMLFYMLNAEEQEREEERLMRILSDPNIRYFMTESIFWETTRTITWINQRPRFAAFLREHFQPPVARLVPGNPLEFAEPVEYLVYARAVPK